jgi:GntR family transcriptional regulator, transcriptional repressor for pyruvate dehydrogenase complex
MAPGSHGRYETTATRGLRAVEKRRLYEDIVGQIQALIEHGRLRPGDRLPAERELAEVFEVSRHSVREAIRALEQRGVLASRAGSGTFVAVDDENLAADFLARAMDRKKVQLAEIFQFRRMIEPQIAFLAARNASSEDIEECRRILRQQEQGARESTHLTDLDHTFHLLMARASRNGIVLRIVERILDILGETRAESTQSEARARLSVDGHARIVDAMQMGNADAARQAMDDHLKDIEEVVLKKPTG